MMMMVGGGIFRLFHFIIPCLCSTIGVSSVGVVGGEIVIPNGGGG